MATKAELEAELAALRAKLAESKPTTDAPNDDADNGPDEKTETTASILKEHDVHPEDLEELWTQFVAELDGLPQRKPLLTAAAAFALGFLLGRATK